MLPLLLLLLPLLFLLLLLLLPPSTPITLWTGSSPLVSLSAVILCCLALGPLLPLPHPGGNGEPRDTPTHRRARSRPSRNDCTAPLDGGKDQRRDKKEEKYVKVMMHGNHKTKPPSRGFSRTNTLCYRWTSPLLKPRSPDDSYGP